MPWNTAVNVRSLHLSQTLWHHFHHLHLCFSFHNGMKRFLSCSYIFKLLIGWFFLNTNLLISCTFVFMRYFFNFLPLSKNVSINVSINSHKNWNQSHLASFPQVMFSFEKEGLFHEITILLITRTPNDCKFIRGISYTGK